ncbi:MAG: glutamate ABC transporter substrate-binding protein [Acidimicrobiales bacterium]
MTGRPSTLRRGLTVLLATLGLVAACSSTDEAPFSSGPAEVVDDGGDTAAPTPTPDPACDDGNPRPSLGPPGELPAPGDLPAGSYMAEIRDRGVLRAAVGADTLLFGYLNPETDDLEGFDVEMARLVADAIFGDPDRVELIPVQSADRIAVIEDGTVDLVIKTMTINCQRWGAINFSTVYYESGQRLLVGVDAAIDSVDDIVDERICAVAGTTSLDTLTAASVTTVEVDSWTECLVAFQRGEAEGISTDDTILAGLAAQDPYTEIVGPRFSDEPYGIGLPKDHPEFTEFVNAVLERARQDGTWSALYDTWLAETLGPSGGPPAPSYR